MWLCFNSRHGMIPPVSNVHRKGGKFHSEIGCSFALSSFSESISICVFRSYPDGDGGNATRSWEAGEFNPKRSKLEC